jgi:acyl dehydratase
MLGSNYTLDNLGDFINKEIGISDWVEIDQQRINDFAEVTGDKQWIHIDAPARQRQSVRCDHRAWFIAAIDDGETLYRCGGCTARRFNVH